MVISLRKFSILALLCCWYQQISYAMPQKELDIINTGSFVIDCRLSTYADGKKFVWNNTLMQHNDYVYEKVTGLQQLGKNVNYGGSVKRVVYAPFEYGSIQKNTDVWLFADCYGTRGRIHNQGLHTSVGKYGFDKLKPDYPHYVKGILDSIFSHPEIRENFPNSNKAVATAYGVDNFDGKNLSYYDYQYNDANNSLHKLRYYFDEKQNLVAVINLEGNSVSVIDDIIVKSVTTADLIEYAVTKNYKFWEIDDLRSNPYTLKVDYIFMSNLMLGKVALLGHPKGDAKDVL